MAAALPLGFVIDDLREIYYRNRRGQLELDPGPTPAGKETRP
jgi:hypothetical protein